MSLPTSTPLCPRPASVRSGYAPQRWRVVTWCAGTLGPVRGVSINAASDGGGSGFDSRVETVGRCQPAGTRRVDVAQPSSQVLAARAPRCRRGTVTADRRLETILLTSACGIRGWWGEARVVAPLPSRIDCARIPLENQRAPADGRVRRWNE